MERKVRMLRAPDVHFRHEWKHEINACDSVIIQQRLKAVAKPDPNTVGGKYRIRSLYFDNIYDKALREKIDGVNCREKYRIRFYNDDTSFIHLEKKSKMNGLCSKESALLTVDEAQRLADDDLSWMQYSPEPLVQELYSKWKRRGRHRFQWRYCDRRRKCSCKPRWKRKQCIGLRQ